MKIYNKIVFDSKGKIVEEDSFEYKGPIMRLWGAGAGGGGSSIAIDVDIKEDYQELFDGSGGGSYLDQDFASIANASWATSGNPYTGEAAYDPSAEMDEAQTQVDAFISAVSNLNYSTDWEGIIDTVVGKLSTVGLSSKEDMSTLVSSVISEAINQAASVAVDAVQRARTDADAIIDESIPNVDALVDTALADASADGKTLTDTNISEAEDRALHIADEATFKAVSVSEREAEMSISKASEKTTSEYSKTKSEIYTKVDADMTSVQSLSKSDVDSMVDSVVSFALSRVNGLILYASNAASNASSGAPILALREAFENRKNKAHMRSIARFASGMADANAVIGNTGFIKGLALLESDYQDALDAFDAENAIRIYQQTFPLYVESFNRILSSHLDLYIREISEYTQSLRSDYSIYTGLFVNMFTRYLDVYLRIVPEYLRAYGTILPEYLRSANGLAEIRTRVVEALSQAQSNLVRDLSRDNSDTAKRVTAGHLEAQVRRDMLFEGSKQDFINRASSQVAQMWEREVNMDYVAAHTQVELDRIKAVAFSEEYQQDLFIDVSDAKWDLEVLQVGANIIAGVPGGTVSNPPVMTRGQSALSGAFAGAALGAKTGNPWAIGIGAVLGFLRGYYGS